jgi:peroxiredoxin
MKKIILLVAGFLLPLITIAQEKDFILKVQISNADKNTRVYLAYQIYGKKIIDSAVQKNEVYIISGKSDRPLNATLVFDNEGLGIQALIQKTKQGGDINALKFYIYPGIINLKTDKLIKNLVFIKSPMNTDYLRLQTMLKPIQDRQMYISNQLKAGNYVHSGNEKPSEKPLTVSQSLVVHNLVRELDSLKTATRPILKKFISQNPNSYISLVSLEEYAGSFPDLTVIEPMYNHLGSVVKNTITGKTYYKFLMDRKNLIAGTPAPLFTQNDTAGNPVSLSSFRGKYILLDFWASWCGPCRQDNPELVKIFNDFKGKNFTILGISFDEMDGKKSWIKAIKEDQLNWTQVSDLKHWDNQLVKLYGVGAIPQSFLIDPNGIIIAKGLDTKELRKKLEEILSK